MLIEAAYAKWKRSAKVCRPWSCLAEIVCRADTAPTEALLAFFTLAYGLRLAVYGPGYWPDPEYMYAVGMGIPVWCWPAALLIVGTLQSWSLFSRYPLTRCSRIGRLVATILTTVIWFNDAVVHHLLAGNEPEWMFPAALSVGGVWIIIRTRSIRDGW